MNENYLWTSFLNNLKVIPLRSQPPQLQLKIRRLFTSVTFQCLSPSIRRTTFAPPPLFNCTLGVKRAFSIILRMFPFICSLLWQKKLSTIFNALKLEMECLSISSLSIPFTWVMFTIASFVNAPGKRAAYFLSHSAWTWRRLPLKTWSIS